MASSGQWEMVDSLLSDAERVSGLWDTDRCAPQPEAGMPQRSQDPEARRMAGHLLALQAYSTAIRGDIDTARELARSAIDCVPPEDRAIRTFAATLLGSALRLGGDLVGASRVWTKALAESRSAGGAQDVIILLGSLAAVEAEQGHLHKAHAISREILDLARAQIGRGAWSYPLLGPTHSRLGTLYLEWNDLPAALDQAQEGVRLSESWGHLEALAAGYVVLARALQATGDAEGALSAIRKAGELSARLSPWYSARTKSEQARMWLAQGNLNAAAHWAQGCGLTTDDTLSFDRVREYLTLARVLVSQGKAGEALGLLSRLLDLTEAAGALGYVVEALVIKALALQAQRSVEEALSTLPKVLAIAEPEGYVWTFISEGEGLRSLLQRAAVQGIAPEYVSRLLEAYETASTRRKKGPEQAASPTAPVGKAAGTVRGGVAPLVEPLSERELEVLRLLDTSLSVPEIAERLVVSASTVRSHVKSIYGKLGVHNRLQALEYARELKLLP
jgi:LuxR family maltose regulon positive regulatory protein